MNDHSNRFRRQCLALTGLVCCLGLAEPLHIAAQRREASAAGEPRYTVAFASFAPLDTDIFVADRDGANARPLFAHPALDYNADVSPDGRWIVFTSTRDGSADLYRACLTGPHSNG